MKEQFIKVGTSLISWSWTKKLLYWIVMSAGTGAECAFLIASLWVTINASVHSFVLLFMSEQTTIHLSELATVAYVGLPECILALAIVTTLSHIRVWAHNHADRAAGVWSILYGLPTVIFLVLSLITIGCSLLSINFQLPPYMIVIRGLSGYFYGLIALLYTQLGTQQESDRLQEKDRLLSVLRQEKDAAFSAMVTEKDAAFSVLQRNSEKVTTQLQADITRVNDELQLTKEQLAESINTQTRLANVVNKASEPTSHAYSDELKNWLDAGHKTISIDDIVSLTGHHRRKVNNAIASNALVTASRNKTLVLTASFVSWLQNNEPPTAKDANTTPQLRIVNG